MKKNHATAPSDEHKKTKTIRRALGGATAIGVGLSLILSGLFGSTEELTRHNEETILRQQLAPVVMMVEAEEEEPTEDTETEQEEEDEKGIFGKIRKWILRIPRGVRALVGVPLWALGTLLSHALSGLWSAISVPVVSLLVKYVVAALLIIAVFAVTAKCIFPHMPLRKILRPKNLLYLLIGTGILMILDRVLLLVWNDYSRVRTWAFFIGGLLVLTAAILPMFRRYKKAQQRKLAAGKARKRSGRDSEKLLTDNRDGQSNADPRALPGDLLEQIYTLTE